MNILLHTHATKVNVAEFSASVCAHAAWNSRMRLTQNLRECRRHQLASLALHWHCPGHLAQHIDTAQNVSHAIVVLCEWLHLHQIQLPLIVNTADYNWSSGKMPAFVSVQSVHILTAEPLLYLMSAHFAFESAIQFSVQGLTGTETAWLLAVKVVGV